MKTQQVVIRGTPDYLICYKGVFIALELKSDEKFEADALQKYNLRKIEKAGGVAFTAHPKNWNMIFNFLKTLKGVKWKLE